MFYPENTTLSPPTIESMWHTVNFATQHAQTLAYYNITNSNCICLSVLQFLYIIKPVNKSLFLFFTKHCIIFLSCLKEQFIPNIKFRLSHQSFRICMHAVSWRVLNKNVLPNTIQRVALFKVSCVLILVSWRFPQVEVWHSTGNDLSARSLVYGMKVKYLIVFISL